jgi:hypothetical protein
VARLGCGVTAYDYADALELVRQRVFSNAAMPPVVEIIENVELTCQEPCYVLPNMGLPFRRGVWFPEGYGSMD